MATDVTSMTVSHQDQSFRWPASQHFFSNRQTIRHDTFLHLTRSLAALCDVREQPLQTILQIDHATVLIVESK
jgi:hypothetical protein